jgi:RHS repeat-associated protein
MMGFLIFWRSKINRDGSHSYIYDTLNRLTQAINPLPTNSLESFNYDPVGNRTNSNQNGTSIFNTANQLLEDANFTYQYDNNGNQITKTAKIGGTLTQYEYDAENKLVRVVSPTNTVNYRYDGLGRRVEKEVIAGSTTVVKYVYDNEDILLELDGANQIVARYTHGPGIDEPLIMEKNSQPFYYHADGLGSIAELTNQSGTVVQRYTYSSFGKIESQLDSNFIQPYAFTAREFDPETGLNYYRARQYDGSIGRFLQEDPLRFTSGGDSFYPYVLNNPINFTDATGKIIDIILDIGFIGYDLYRVLVDNLIQNCDNLGQNLTALGGDILGAIIPGVTGVGSATRVGGKITGYTKHGLNQAISREGTGVAPKAILDAVKNPQKVIERSGGITEYVGEAARVRLNEAGKVVTVIPTSSTGFRTPVGR